ncbi:MAG: S-layer homology domain-containing protein, partial [Eubacteriales bacterium]|nr:S-layer homology domain-containing protein [Eubacteriales bacterium]
MHIKRALSFVTVLCLLLSLPGIAQPSYAAKQQDNTLGLLSALGIVEQDEKFSEDTPLTREEAAVFLHRLLGGMDASGANFPDVSPDSDSYSAISVVSSAKIMSGYPDGSFGIYDHMTVEQMTKALVSILGYGVAAAQKGGYPSGYLAVAVDLKLFENVAFETSKPISKASALQMIYNSLEAPMMIVEDYINTKLVIDESKTLLSSVFKTRKTRGIITGDGTRSIYLNGKGAKGEKIAIDNVEYAASSGVDVKSYLGYRVEAFVRYVNDDSNEEVIYLAPSRLNDVLNIKSDDILNVSLRRIEYIDDNDKEVDAEISRNADFLYNGVAKVPNSPDMLDIEYGEVTLIDNDGDGMFDVVIIRSQILAVVESVNASDMVVSFKHGIPYLDLSETKDLAIVKDGEKIELSQLVSGNVVAICADEQIVQNGMQLPSPDSTYIEINVFDKIVTDKVAEISDDYIVIGKRKYQTTPYFEELDEGYKVTINAGTIYKFYLDGQNRIVFAEKLS